MPFGFRHLIIFDIFEAQICVAVATLLGIVASIVCHALFAPTRFDPLNKGDARPYSAIIKSLCWFFVAEFVALILYYYFIEIIEHFDK